MTSEYLLQKIARHGASAQRLLAEREARTGEFADHALQSAIAFDAADYVWTALCLAGVDEAQETREARNTVAEAILAALRGIDWLQA